MRLIDADAIKIIPPYGTGMTFARGAIYVLDKIAEMPTIEADPIRRGEWIDLGSDGRFGGETRCSKCGEIYWKWMSKFDYCPNCGAMMKERV